MKRIIYAYFNDVDCQVLEKLIFQSGATIYAKDFSKASKIVAFSNKLDTFYIQFQDNNRILFSPCFFINNYLQCGFFCIEDTTNVELKKLFSVIKKYIIKHYTLSTDKHFYCGPDIYQDWLENRVCLPVLVQYEKHILPEIEIVPLFQKLMAEGYIIKNNNVRLKAMNSLDQSLDSFVIFDRTSKVLTTIINKKIIRYENGSECVFVYRNNGLYEFVLDKRISIQKTLKIISLFKRIQSWAGDATEANRTGDGLREP